jgi:hypothetical protein
VETFDTTDYTGKDITSSSEEQICWQVWADTPDRNVRKHIQGKLSARIMQSKPEISAPKRESPTAKQEMPTPKHRAKGSKPQRAS